MELDDAEREELLGTGGIGVLAFSSPREDPPHAIPVSYGYDAAEDDFYFRLAVDADSEKGEVAGRPVTFLTYGSEAGEWWSVVAKGVLHATDEAAIATQTLAGLDRVQIPLLDVFEAPPRDTAFEFVRLDPDDLTSRAEWTTP